MSRRRTSDSTDTSAWDSNKRTIFVGQRNPQEFPAEVFAESDEVGDDEVSDTPPFTSVTGE